MISRGAGLSYVAASFGGGATTVEHGAFDRILDFDPVRRTLTVEAGARLGDVFTFLAPRGFYLRTQPGHPSISIGGCIAADVHGKNQPRDGTFASQVLRLSLYHPRHGVLELSRDDEPGVFQLTCGGYGLTGAILSATLRVDAIPSFGVERRRRLVRNVYALPEELEREGRDAEFLFTWHDFMARGEHFGRGFVDAGRFDETVTDAVLVDDASWDELDAGRRGGWRAPLFSVTSARAFTAMYYAYSSRAPKPRSLTLFSSIFPIVGRETYFRLFGTAGFLEYQALVPADAFDSFAKAIEVRLARDRVPVTLASTKVFDGAGELLRFTGTGVALAINLARSRRALEFMSFLDDLVLGTGAKPNIIKDSRLSREVVRRTYDDYERFRTERRAFDQDLVCRSALSERLGL
jgi:decaprenylphospho-beta-D-ribofuranose 2-oxidase